MGIQSPKPRFSLLQLTYVVIACSIVFAFVNRSIVKARKADAAIQTLREQGVHVIRSEAKLFGFEVSDDLVRKWPFSVFGESSYQSVVQVVVPADTDASYAAALADVGAIKSIDIYNLITQQQLAFLAQIDGVEQAAIECDFAKGSMDAIEKWDSLTRLLVGSVHSSKLSGIETLASLQAISLRNIQGNTTSLFHELSRLQNLRELNIESCPLELCDRRIYSQLQHIHSIRVNSCSGGSVFCKGIGHLRSLKHLTIQGLDIDDSGLNDLNGLCLQLERLCFGGCDISPDSRERPVNCI